MTIGQVLKPKERSLLGKGTLRRVETWNGTERVRIRNLRSSLRKGLYRRFWVVVYSGDGTSVRSNWTGDHGQWEPGHDLR